MVTRWIGGLLLALMLTAGCGDDKGSVAQNPETGEAELAIMPLRGRVVSVDAENRQLTIAHDEIPNYMMAMTMPFQVKDTTLLEGVTLIRSPKRALTLAYV